MGKKKIAVIGAGIAGTTLAYALLKDGRFDLSMFAAKDAEDIRTGRIPSTQGHFERLLRTEERYDFPDYGDVNDFKQIELLINGQRMFIGNINGKAISIDQRIYLSELLDGLIRRGVNFRKRRISNTDLLSMSKEYDAIIDCSGKIGPVAEFPAFDGMRNAPAAPLRVCSAGIFNGFEAEEDSRMSYNIVPGLGELFEMTTMTTQGLRRMILLEAVPGGELDRIKGDKGPDAFADGMKGVLEAYFPHIIERVKPDHFRVIDPLAYTRIAIKPEVRVPYMFINETLVLGCGDSVVLNDPITGQGANAASYCADMLYMVLSECADQAWDSAVGELYWSRTREYVTKMSEWTNAMMGPPSEAFNEMMGRAVHSQETADEIVAMFSDPIKAHAAFFSSDRAHTGK